MGSICEQLAGVTTAEEGLRGRNVLSVDFYFYYANCSQIPLVLVSRLVGYRINELKCYYYTTEYIAHMTGGAHTAVYVLKSRHVLDIFTSQLFCAGSACVRKLISRAGRLFEYLVYSNVSQNSNIRLLFYMYSFHPTQLYKG